MSIRIVMSTIRSFPIRRAVNSNPLITSDIRRWKEFYNIQEQDVLAYLLCSYKEFVSLMLYRLRDRKWLCRYLRICYKPQENLYITANSIGGGVSDTAWF